MYAVLGTCPDLAAALSVVSRYLENPRPVHVYLAIRILQYVNGTLDVSLVYSPSKTFELIGYLDASYGNEFCYKSRSGYAPGHLLRSHSQRLGLRSRG